MRLSNDKKLRKIHAALGDLAFNAFLHVVGGENLYIPKGFDPNEPDKKTRNATIKYDFYEQKLSVIDLTVKYGLTRAAIYKVIGRK